MLWGERRTYQLTQGELASAYRINLLDKLRRPLRLGAFALILVLAAIGWRNAQNGGDLVIIAAVLVFLAVFTIARVTIGASWLARKSARSQSVLCAPHELLFAEDLLRMHNEAGDSSFRWGSFHQVRFHRDFVLLFVGHEIFVPVPRRALHVGDVEEMAHRLSQAGVRVMGSVVS